MKKFAWSQKKHHDYLERGLLRHLHRERLKFIRQQINGGENRPAAGDCLDLGCGDGVFMKHFLSENSCHFIGCDADYNRLLRAGVYCNNGNIFVNALAENTPFADQSFKTVLLHHVLEHTEDDLGVIAECRRLLKPGGTFIIGVPNEDSVNGRMLRSLHPRLYREGEHINFYSERKILSILMDSGFQIQKVKRVGFIFPQYHIHMLLISNKITFALGNFLTRFLKFTADSLIIVCTKSVN